MADLIQITNPYKIKTCQGLGNYALEIYWDDDHQSIFTFDQLRSELEGAIQAGDPHLLRRAGREFHDNRLIDRVNLQPQRQRRRGPGRRGATIS